MKKPAGEAVTALIGLGSNVGDRLGHLRAGVTAIHAHPQLSVERVSEVYETEYVGPGTQSPYLNACASVRCLLKAEQLLDLLQGIERDRGRVPDTHMQPRPLDLDILLFGDEIRRDKRLEVPHPRLRERAFVLVPLAGIAGDEKFPDSGETVTGACAKIRRKGAGAVERFAGRIPWPIRTE